MGEIDELIQAFEKILNNDEDIRNEGNQYITDFKNFNIIGFIQALADILRRDGISSVIYTQSLIFLYQSFEPNFQTPLALIRQQWLSESIPQDLRNAVKEAITRGLLLEDERSWKNSGHAFASVLRVEQDNSELVDVSLHILKQLVQFTEYSNTTHVAALYTINEIVRQKISTSSANFHVELLGLVTTIFAEHVEEQQTSMATIALSSYLKNYSMLFTQDHLSVITESCFAILPILTESSLEFYIAIQHLLSAIVKYLYHMPFFSEPEHLSRFLDVCTGGITCNLISFACETMLLWERIAKFEYSLLKNEIVAQKYEMLHCKYLPKRSELAHPHPPPYLCLCGKVIDTIGPILIEGIQKIPATLVNPERGSDGRFLHSAAFLTLKALFKVIPNEIFQGVSNLWGNFRAFEDEPPWPVLNGLFLSLGVISPRLKYDWQKNRQNSIDRPNDRSFDDRKTENAGSGQCSVDVRICQLLNFAQPHLMSAVTSHPVFTVIDTALFILGRIERTYAEDPNYTNSCSRPEGFAQLSEAFYNMAMKVNQIPPRLISQALSTMLHIFSHIRENSSSHKRGSNAWLDDHFDQVMGTIYSISQGSEIIENAEIIHLLYVTIASFFCALPSSSGEKIISYVDTVLTTYASLGDDMQDIAMKLAIITMLTRLYRNQRIGDLLHQRSPPALVDGSFGNRNFASVNFGNANFENINFGNIRNGENGGSQVSSGNLRTFETLFESLKLRSPELHEDVLRCLFTMLEYSKKTDGDEAEVFKTRLLDYIPDGLQSGSPDIVTYMVLVVSKLMNLMNAEMADQIDNVMILIQQCLADDMFNQSMYPALLKALSNVIKSFQAGQLTTEQMFQVLDSMDRFVIFDVEEVKASKAKRIATFECLAGVLFVYSAILDKILENGTDNPLITERKLRKKLFLPVDQGNRLGEPIKVFVNAAITFFHSTLQFGTKMNIQLNRKANFHLLLLGAASASSFSPLGPKAIRMIQRLSRS